MLYSKGTRLVCGALLSMLVMSCAQVAGATTVGNSNAFVPNANYNGGTSTTTTSTTGSSTQYLTPEQIAALTGSSGTTTSTGTSSSTGSTSKNTQYLTPEQIAALTGSSGTTTSTSSTRNSQFLTA